MLSRLLIEHHAEDARPIIGIDLDDERPSLVDCRPQDVFVENIRTVRDQMKLFDNLIITDGVIKIIDLSRREFSNFFSIADKIGFFQELRRRSIIPLVLYIVDPNPTSAIIYNLIRKHFTDCVIIPVRNRINTKGMRYSSNFPCSTHLRVLLEIPILTPAAMAVYDSDEFTLSQLSRAESQLNYERGLFGKFRYDSHAELKSWLRRIRFQFREIELSLMFEKLVRGPSNRTD